MARNKRDRKKSVMGETIDDTKSGSAKLPRHSVEKALRIPRAIFDQNAGKECMPKEATGFLGIKATGPFMVEVSSATKFCFLDRPAEGKICPSELAKKILLPQDQEDELAGYA